MTTPLRLAFIGGGLNSAVGRAHQSAIKLDGHFELKAGAFSLENDVNAESARAYGVSKEQNYFDWREMIEFHGDVFDAAVVLTPTPTHSEIVMECIRKGVPVICEKALCGNKDEALAIKASLAEKNGFLAVTYNYSGYPMLRELQERVRTGKLGKIQQIHIEMPQESFIRRNIVTDSPNLPQSWRQQDSVVPTVSLDLGVHLHQMVHFLTGETPVEVVTKEDHFGTVSAVVDNVMCIASYTNNLVCNMWFGKSALGERNGLRIRLFGTEGAAEWYQLEPEYLHLVDSYGRRSTIDRSDPDNMIANQHRYDRFKPGHPAGFIEAFANYYADIASLLASDGRPGAESPYVEGVDVALESLLFLEALTLSSKKKSWVSIEELLV